MVHHLVTRKQIFPRIEVWHLKMTFEIRESNFYSSTFLFHYYFGYLESFVFLYKLYNFFCSNSVKNAIGYLTRIALNL